jgi:beta-ketoacyl-acyl-carrier-protein synthase II
MHDVRDQLRKLPADVRAALRRHLDELAGESPSGEAFSEDRLGDLLSQLRTRYRVVITGMGAITPLALNVKENWQGLVAGRSGIGLLTQIDASNYPTKIGGEVKGFDPTEYMPFKEARRMERFSQLAVAAAKEALEDAQVPVDGLDPEQVGVLLGSAIGGLDATDEAVRNVIAGKRVSPFYLVRTVPNMAAFHVCHIYGLKGYNNTITTACAAGLQAVGEAAEVIRRGAAQVMVAGGTESSSAEIGLAGFSAMRGLSTRNDDPQGASRPFDKDRDGFVCSEGCGILVLEELSHALNRGAHIYAEILGYSATSDAYNLAAPDPEAEGAARAIRWALQDAGAGPEDVDYINAHGTSTVLNDSMETVAIKKVFGEHAYRVPVSSTKSMIGHMFGGAGAMETIVCALTIEHGIIHPTINYETPDPECDLDYVPNVARKATVNVTLSNSFGLGGQDACLVVGRYLPEGVI